MISFCNDVSRNVTSMQVPIGFFSQRVLQLANQYTPINELRIGWLFQYKFIESHATNLEVRLKIFPAHYPYQIRMRYIGKIQS